ncbi:MAG TPA: hypothetical protein VEZ16_02085 [Microvirga sp.]|nr:hypothetical protein [Microvirga sp.]
MTTRLKKAAAMGAVALTLFGGMSVGAGQAEAGQRTGTWRYYPAPPYPYRSRSNEGAALAAGIVGGLAIGALAGAATAPRYNPPTYAYPVYGDPRYMPRRDCYTTKHTVRDPWGATTTHSTTYCD